MAKASTLSSSILFIFLAGCATTIYQKPGATQVDWQRDNNDCLVKANQAGYPGGDFAANLNRRRFIDMCLQGQGWAKQTQETVQAQSQQSAELEQKRANFKAKMDSFNQQVNSICDKPDYAVIVAKTPCNPGEISFENMADVEKINAAQKKVFLKWRSENAAVQKEIFAYVRVNAINGQDRQWADYLDSILPAIDTYNLDLYKGKTTWGEYNKSRKDQTIKNQAEQRKIYQSVK